MGAKGYNALALQHGADRQSKVVQDILKYVHDKGQGTGPKDEVGQVLYMRGLIIQMLGVEAVRRAQERFGKGKVMTGEQVRWGLENLTLDQKKLDALGFAGVMRPVSTSCQDHMGSTWARIHTWDGSEVGLLVRLVPGRRADPQADDQGRGRQVRGGEEADAPRTPRTASPDSLRESGWPCLPVIDGTLPNAPPADREAPRRRRARAGSRRAANRQGRASALSIGEHKALHEHSQHRSQRQRHRGHLQPRDPGAQGRVAAGARRRHRGHPGRQRRGQDHHAARHLQPAQGRARRGDQGLDRAARRAHREPLACRPGAARRGAGDGRPPLLRPPDHRGKPADRRLHPHAARPRWRPTWRRSTPTSRA